MLTRQTEEPLVYRVDVFLPAGRSVHSELRLDPATGPTLQPEIEDAWARDETLKLARVLKRTPKAKLSRWRGP